MTAVVLMLVLLALGWMAVAACFPEWDWRLSLDVQVGVVLGLADGGPGPGEYRGLAAYAHLVLLR